MRLMQQDFMSALVGVRDQKLDCAQAGLPNKKKRCCEDDPNDVHACNIMIIPEDNNKRARTNNGELECDNVTVSSHLSNSNNNNNNNKAAGQVLKNDSTTTRDLNHLFQSSLPKISGSVDNDGACTRTAGNNPPTRVIEGLYESIELNSDETVRTVEGAAGGKSGGGRLPQSGETLRMRFRWPLSGGKRKKGGDTFWIHYDPYDWYLIWKEKQRIVDLSIIGMVQCQLPLDMEETGFLMEDENDNHYMMVEATVIQSISFQDFPKYFQRPSMNNDSINKFASKMSQRGDNGDDAEHLTNFQWCNWSDYHHDGSSSRRYGQEMMFMKWNGSWYLVGTHNFDERNNQDNFRASFTYVLSENVARLNLMRY